MKIAILDMDNLKNPHWGAGQARATREIFKRLSKEHKVTVCCSKYPGWKNYRADGISYIHIGMGSRFSKLNNAAYLLLLPLTVRKIKADIILENFIVPISTSFAPLFTKIPVIGYATTFDAPFFARKYHLPFGLIEKFGCRYYEYFVGLSKFQVDKMRSLNARVLTKVIPEGVSEEYFTIRRKKPAYILFIGRFDIQQKGIDLLLKAYAKKKRTLKYPLVLAGYGADEQKILRLIDKLRLNNLVSLAGPAFGEKKRLLLSHAAYVTLPSRFEGFSLLSLEALASGLPIVCFDIPALTWASRNVAVKVKPFSVTQFANGLQLLEDKKRSTAMSKAARKLAKTYTWDDVAASFNEFFYEVKQHSALQANALVLTKKQTQGALNN